MVELQGIGRDITDLKIADMEVEQRRKEVTHLTRVAILGELSGALAHELNQPLTAILSNAQAAQRLLTRAPLDPAVVGEILDDIVTDDLRAGEVITRLRALLKRGEASLRPLDLNDVAAEVLALARSELIDRHVTVSTRLMPGLPGTLGDRVQLQQVMLNLLLNACEAMSSKGWGERMLTVSTALDGNGFRPDRDRRSGQRHSAGCRRSAVRAVLYDQAAGTGSRAVDLPLDHRCPRRPTLV